MVYDSVQNADRYGGPDSFIAKGLKAAAEHKDKPPGRYGMDGDDLYVVVLQYTSSPLADAQWETHHKYIDIQYPVSGAERMGVARPDDVRVTKPYDAAGDAELAQGEGTFVECRPGEFVVFYPGEPHMPGVCVDAPAPMTKIVVKVRAEGLDHGI